MVKEGIMKLLIALALLAHTTSFAGEFVGYSTLQPSNQYKIVNASGAVVFSATADTVKDVSLRDGYAVVQTVFDNVSLINENGSVIVDQVYGSKYLVSDELLAIYNPGAIASVYDHSGKRLFVANRVQSIGIANSRFAVNDLQTGTVDLYSRTGEKLFSQYGVERSWISEGFFATLNHSGLFQLRNAKNKLISSDSGVKDLKISNQFAAYTTSQGTMKVSTTEGFLLERNNVADYGVSDSMVWTRDLFGISVYDIKGALVYSDSSYTAFSVSHDLVVVQTRAKTLNVYNTVTQARFGVGYAENFSVTDGLILVKNQGGQYAVYDADGKRPLSETNSDIENVSISNEMIAIQYTGLRKTKVLNARVQAQSSAVLNQIQVNRLNLSQNRDELNWLAF
jgi:hypothetical protein